MRQQSCAQVNTQQRERNRDESSDVYISHRLSARSAGNFRSLLSFLLPFFFLFWLAGWAMCVCVSRERITRHPLRTCSAGCRGVPCAIAHRFLPSSIYYHHSAGLSGRSHPLYTARSICRRCGIVFLYIPFWVSFIFTLTGLTTDDETGWCFHQFNSILYPYLNTQKWHESIYL